MTIMWITGYFGFGTLGEEQLSLQTTVTAENTTYYILNTINNQNDNDNN